ncbi:MAG TPA: tRNA (adenosine(37)-N6)-threonylcarbamoyltransferase complex ATPase subunit type 1 TsaE [Caldimonas sp.]|nr:tRNA (adenosine(37)-N6)-threonylcarbamoyltransferase complex ATPase subunit type 1 TsaE [Caldimonas sp.]
MESVASILETRHAAWPDELACAVSARAIAGRAALRDAFIELHGPLGAGKTTFVRHLLHDLGVQGAIKSPTYALMEPYRADASHGGFAVAHCDFYRFDDPGEWEDAGFREVFAEPGLKLVEWPEKAAGLLPDCDLRVWITPRDGSDARVARFEALSAVGRELLP